MIFVVVVLLVTRVTFWCLERLWLCDMVIWPNRARVEMLFLLLKMLFLLLLLLLFVVVVMMMFMVNFWGLYVA